MESDIKLNDFTRGYIKSYLNRKAISSKRKDSESDSDASIKKQTEVLREKLLQ